jgi:integrase
MPTIKLTQPAVERLKPPTAGRVEYFDNQLPGFGLRVSETGRKTWIVMYRVNGKLIRETLGTTSITPNVADAREQARESLRKAQQDINPVEERREAKRAAQIAAEREPAQSFSAIANRYLREYVEKNTRPATIKETRRILDRDVKPLWGTRPFHDITKGDVLVLIDGIANRRDRPRREATGGAAVQANRTLARLKTLFRWAKDNDLITVDPTDGVRWRVKEVARDRALTDDEIRRFWAGCGELGWPFGRMFKLLLLTAQRRDEVGRMEWSEVALDKCLWTIPRDKAKNDRTHEVHLSDLAMEILNELPKISRPKANAGGTEPSPYLFTTNGERPVSGFSKAKARLDEHMLQLLRAELEQAAMDPERAKIESWILHDLRRTAATGMARLNIAPHVVDRILNHVSGTIRGVAAVYNRHAYLDERKTALEAWGRYVEGVVRPTPVNVVPFAAAR